MRREDKVLVGKFLDGRARSSWLKLTHMEVFLRKSQRFTSENGPPELVDAIDLASIEVDKGQGRRGHLSKLVSYLCEMCPDHYIYVETVMTDEMQKWVEKVGVFKPNLVERCYIAPARDVAAALLGSDGEVKKYASR